MREDGFTNPSCPSEFDSTCRLKLKLNYCYMLETVTESGM